jgi:hypothetical protein
VLLRLSPFTFAPKEKGNTVKHLKNNETDCQHGTASGMATDRASAT